MSGVAVPSARFSVASEAVSTSVRKSLAALAVRVWRSSRRARRSVTASSVAACAASSSRFTPRTLTGDGDEHGGTRSRVVQGAQRHALEVEDVARAERTRRAGDAAQLDLARADDDERVAPLVLVVGPVVPWRDGDHAHGHSAAARPNEPNVESENVTISTISPPAIVSTSSASATNVSEPGART